MVLKALYPLLQKKVVYILQTNLSQNNQEESFLCFCGGFFFVTLCLLSSFLLIELHHLDMLEVINHTCCLHDPLAFLVTLAYPEARRTICWLLAEQMQCVELKMLNATQDEDTWREKPKLGRHIQDVCKDTMSLKECRRWECFASCLAKMQHTWHSSCEDTISLMPRKQNYQKPQSRSQRSSQDTTYLTQLLQSHHFSNATRVELPWNSS